MEIYRSAARQRLVAGWKVDAIIRTELEDRRDDDALMQYLNSVPCGFRAETSSENQDLVARLRLSSVTSLGAFTIPSIRGGPFCPRLVVRSRGCESLGILDVLLLLLYVIGILAYYLIFIHVGCGLL